MEKKEEIKIQVEMDSLEENSGKLMSYADAELGLSAPVAAFTLLCASMGALLACCDEETLNAPLDKRKTFIRVNMNSMLEAMLRKKEDDAEA